MDGSSFPPCRKVLIENFKRANYVAGLWSNATSISPPSFIPENCGWLYENGKYIKWYAGDFSPSLINIIMENEQEFIAEESDDDKTIEYSDDDDGDNDSE